MVTKYERSDVYIIFRQTVGYIVYVTREPSICIEISLTKRTVLCEVFMQKVMPRWSQCLELVVELTHTQYYLLRRK